MIIKSSILLISLSLAQTVFANGFMVSKATYARKAASPHLTQLTKLNGFKPSLGYKVHTNTQGNLVSVSQNLPNSMAKHKWKFDKSGNAHLYKYVKDGQGRTDVYNSKGELTRYFTDTKASDGSNVRTHFNSKNQLFKTTVKESSNDGSFMVKQKLGEGSFRDIYSKSKNGDKTYLSEPKRFKGVLSPTTPTNGNQMQDDAQALTNQMRDDALNQKNGQNNQNDNVQNSKKPWTAKRILKYGGGSLLGLILLGLLLNGTKKSQEPASSEVEVPAPSSDPSFSTANPFGTNPFDGRSGVAPPFSNGMGMGTPTFMATGGNMAPAIPVTSGSNQPPIFV